MLSEIIIDTLKEAVSDISGIGTQILLIFIGIFFISIIINKVFPSMEKRREEANLRLLEARASLEEIKLARLEAEERLRHEQEKEEENCSHISDAEDEFAYWQEEETKAEAEIESEEKDSEEENESFMARFC